LKFRRGENFLLVFRKGLVGALELIFEVDLVAGVVVGERRAVVDLVADVGVVVVVEVGLRVAHHLLLRQMTRTLDEFGEPRRG